MAKTRHVDRESPVPPSPETFAINPDCQVSVEHVGLGRHKVVMVDGFYRYPDRVLKQALELPYTDRFEIVGNFPGVRASVNASKPGRLWMRSASSGA